MCVFRAVAEQVAVVHRPRGWPVTGQWSPVSSLVVAVLVASHVCVGRLIYVCGGFWGGFSRVLVASMTGGGVEGSDRRYCPAGVGGNGCRRRPGLRPGGAMV
ncbi:hypothetical protein Dimus_018063 [Dionaea muscipula]